MRVVVLNPNTSEAMTAGVVAGVQRRLGSRVEVVGLTSTAGPPVIATRETFEAGARAALALIASCTDRVDAFLLACFGDPGLADLRSGTAAPVIGLAEASMVRAAELGRPWAIVTFGDAWRDMLRESVAALSPGTGFVDVFTVPGTGLDAIRDPVLGRQRLRSAIDEAIAQGAATVILGGAALAGMANDLQSKARLLDCVDCASDALAASLPGYGTARAS